MICFCTWFHCFLKCAVVNADPVWTWFCKYFQWVTDQIEETECDRRKSRTIKSKASGSIKMKEAFQSHPVQSLHREVSLPHDIGRVCFLSIRNRPDSSSPKVAPSLWVYLFRRLLFWSESYTDLAYTSIERTWTKHVPHSMSNF